MTVTRTELKKMKKAELIRKAHDLGLPVCRDFTVADLREMIWDRMQPRQNRTEYDGRLLTDDGIAECQ